MFQNHLLNALDTGTLNLLSPHLSSIALPDGFEIEDPDAPVEWAYFLEEGIASAVAADRKAEVGLVGVEGMTGLSLALHSERPTERIYMQVPGHGTRMRAAAFSDLLLSVPSLQQLVLRYVHTMIVQISSTAASNAMDDIPTRLARWLLMAGDRIKDGEMPLSHEYLSIMFCF